MAQEAFYKLFVNMICDLYGMETQIINQLPNYINQASYADLKETLQKNLTEARNHKTRLEQIFSLLNEKPKESKSNVIFSIFNDEKTFLDNDFPPAVKDATIICFSQRIAHYEMAAYGAARTYAKLFDKTEEANLLQECLNEVGRANKKYTDLAEGGFFTSGVNQLAMKS